MYEITLRGMRFHALVGIVDFERTTPQPIEIDLVAQVGGGEGVVDYRALYAAASETLAAGHIDFLEEIADRVASRVLAHSARVREVRVAVRKPHVALGGPLDFAEVAVVRAAE